jgi:hypothetical protein
MEDESLEAVLTELVAREPLFHRTERGTGRADFDAMTAEDFWEVGASGEVYDREFVWATLEHRYAAGAADEWGTTDFRLRALVPNVYLLTYLLLQGRRLTRRAPLWDRTTGVWRAVYHQGTATTGASDPRSGA